MTTQTLDAPDIDRTAEATVDAAEKTKPQKKASTAEKKPARDSWLRRVWDRLRAESSPKKKSGKGGSMVKTIFFRLTVILIDYALVSATAMVLIPMLGLWLHQKSGAAKGEYTFDGTIAMWLMPLLFSVLMIAAAEYVVLRGLWRWSTRMIHGAPTSGADREQIESGPASVTTGKSKTNQKKKSNRKRSK